MRSHLLARSLVDRSKPPWEPRHLTIIVVAIIIIIIVCNQAASGRPGMANPNPNPNPNRHGDPAPAEGPATDPEVLAAVAGGPLAPHRDVEVLGLTLNLTLSLTNPNPNPIWIGPGSNPRRERGQSHPKPALHRRRGRHGSARASTGPRGPRDRCPGRHRGVFAGAVSVAGGAADTRGGGPLWRENSTRGEG